jgi:Leucine-rich repeat (LRR) protein
MSKVFTSEMELLLRWMNKTTGNIYTEEYIKNIKFMFYRQDEFPIEEFLHLMPELESFSMSIDRLVDCHDNPGHYNIYVSKLPYTTLDSVPEWISKIKNLKYINLSSNSIGVVPDWLCEMKNIVSLDLSNNKIKQIPESMSKLTNLHSLDISNNSVACIPQFLLDNGVIVHSFNNKID